MVSNQHVHPSQDVAPEFKARYNVIFDQWQAGTLSFPQAVEAIAALKQEASAAGNLANEGGTELIVGVIQGLRANLNDSIQSFERARDLFEKVGNQKRVATCTLNIGESYRLKGNFTRAHEYFHAAYEAAEQLGDIPTQVTALANEGQMLISMKRFAEAQAALEDAYTLGCESWGDDPRAEDNRKNNLCEIHHALAELYLEVRQVKKAWDHARQSLKIAQDLQLAYRLGFAYRAIAEVLTELGRQPESEFSGDPDEYFQAANVAFREVKAEGELAKTMFVHGKSLVKRGKRMAGARKLQQAMVIFTRLGMMDDAARAADMQLDVM
jgi:tetratricopeptide (TPR) repeat protein